MIKVEVVSQEKKWLKKIRNIEFFFNYLCKSFPKKYRFLNKKLSLTLLLSNNKNIKKLNKRFRKKNKSTDILSFPFHNKKNLKDKLKKDKEIYLGDIIINLNKIKNKHDKKKFKIEFNKLWIHGLVHLFGYDHKKNKDFNTMQKIEKKFLLHID